MKDSTILSLVGVAVIMLVIGTGLGSVAFPTTRTETSTETITSPITLISSVTLNEIQTVTQNLSSQSHTATTVTSTMMAVGTCTVATAFEGTRNQSSSSYYVQVNYAGQWNSAIQGFSSFNESLDTLTVNQCLPSGGNVTFAIQNWNPGGESYLCAWADKFDSSNGTLTVSVSYGAATYSYSTSEPYGSVTTCLGVTPTISA